VTDAAVLLGAMAKTDYTQYLDKNGLDGVCIGISRMYLENADKEKTDILES